MGSGQNKTSLRTASAKMIVILAVATLLPGMQGRTNSFEDRILHTHNQERQALGLPPLHWDPALAKRAQAWADHLAATGKFEHSPNAPGSPLEGENIWGGTSGAFFPEDMVKLWIAEKDHFVEGVFPANSKTGSVQDVSHYTQIIWRGTGTVGCAISQGTKEEIMVCRYSDPGNLIGINPLLS